MSCLKNFHSRYVYPFIVFFWILSMGLIVRQNAFAQDDTRGNNRPKIKGQSEVTTDEEVPVTIQLTDLVVEDKDDWFYPLGFTMKLYEGDDYTFSGRTVTPDKDFEGTLEVRVT